MLQCYDRAGFGHFPPNILCQRVIPAIAGFFVGRTWKVNRTRNSLNYYANFILLKYYTNEAADRIIHTMSGCKRNTVRGFQTHVSPKYCKLLWCNALEPTHWKLNSSQSFYDLMKQIIVSSSESSYSNVFFNLFWS